MADEVDRANNLAQLMLEESIRTNSKFKKIEPTGFCIFCDNKISLKSKKLFCDIDCSEDYEREKRAKERNKT